MPKKVLETAALEKGERITGCETHGMAQRGGSVVSHFKVGGSTPRWCGKERPIA